MSTVEYLVESERDRAVDERDLLAAKLRERGIDPDDLRKGSQP